MVAKQAGERAMVSEVNGDGTVVVQGSEDLR